MDLQARGRVTLKHDYLVSVCLGMPVFPLKGIRTFRHRKRCWGEFIVTYGCNKEQGGNRMSGSEGPIEVRKGLKYGGSIRSSSG